jgi:hypothetical protein
MIKAKELNRENAIEREKIAYSNEMSKIESKIDSIIIENELSILDGNKIMLTIHDEENRRKTLQELIERYNHEGWKIYSSRSWGALFTDIYITI